MHFIRAAHEDLIVHLENHTRWSEMARGGPVLNSALSIM